MPTKAKDMMDRLIHLSQDAVFRLETEPTTTIEYVKLLTFLEEIQTQVLFSIYFILYNLLFNSVG